MANYLTLALVHMIHYCLLSKKSTSLHPQSQCSVRRALEMNKKNGKFSRTLGTRQLLFEYFMGLFSWWFVFSPSYRGLSSSFVC